MSFRLVPKSVTLNDLERRNGSGTACRQQTDYVEIHVMRRCRRRPQHTH